MLVGEQTLSTARAARPRILVLTQLYAPEPNFITSDVAESLATVADVTVVTAHPNYPFGRFYQGTRYWKIEKSIVNGVIIWRVPFLPDHSLSPFRRAISYVSFALVAAIVAPFVSRRPHTVWVYHGPFTTVLPALFFKLAYRSRLVLTCADLWPDSVAAAGVVKSPLLIAAAKAYQRTLMRFADFIIGATRGIVARCRSYGVASDRLAFIPVWIGETGKMAANSGAVTTCRRIVYGGNIGPAQGLESVILAAASFANGESPVQFDIYGTGASVDELQALAARVGASNVKFHGHVPLEEAFEAAVRALAQIICLKASPLFAQTVPSKLFAAFAAGSPILYALEGEAAEIAAASGGAIPFTAGDAGSLVEAITRLISLTPKERETMRSSLKKYFYTNFDPNLLLTRYVDILHPVRHSARTLNDVSTTVGRHVLHLER